MKTLLIVIGAVLVINWLGKSSLIQAQTTQTGNLTTSLINAINYQAMLQ